MSQMWSLIRLADKASELNFCDLIDYGFHLYFYLISPNNRKAIALEFLAERAVNGKTAKYYSTGNEMIRTDELCVQENKS